VLGVKWSPFSFHLPWVNGLDIGNIEQEMRKLVVKSAALQKLKLNLSTKGGTDRTKVTELEIKMIRRQLENLLNDYNGMLIDEWIADRIESEEPPDIVHYSDISGIDSKFWNQCRIGENQYG
jgi:hypothetical protein